MRALAQHLRCFPFSFFFLLSMHVRGKRRKKERDREYVCVCVCGCGCTYGCTRATFFIFFPSLKTYMYIFRFASLDSPDASDWTENVRRSRDILYKYIVLCNNNLPSQCADLSKKAIMLFVFCFSFSFYFVSLSSPLCQSRTFLFFCNDLFFSLSLSLLQHFSCLLYFDFIFLSLFSPSSLSLSFLFLVSPPIKIRLKTRTASLSKRPESVLEARRRASRDPELSPPVSPFPPVLYDGSSDCVA